MCSKIFQWFVCFAFFDQSSIVQCRPRWSSWESKQCRRPDLTSGWTLIFWISRFQDFHCLIKWCRWFIVYFRPGGCPAAGHRAGGPLPKEDLRGAARKPFKPNYTHICHILPSLGCFCKRSCSFSSCCSQEDEEVGCLGLSKSYCMIFFLNCTRCFHTVCLALFVTLKVFKILISTGLLATGLQRLGGRDQMLPETSTGLSTKTTKSWMWRFPRFPSPLEGRWPLHLESNGSKIAMKLNILWYSFQTGWNRCWSIIPDSS